MPSRTEIDPLEILEALRASDEDVEAAAILLDVSSRTLYRRMAECGIKAQLRYEWSQSHCEDAA